MVISMRSLMRGEEEGVKGRIRHSRRIPFWLWFAIAKSLGIRTHPGDRPVVSAILHILTLAAGAGERMTTYQACPGVLTSRFS